MRGTKHLLDRLDAIRTAIDIEVPKTINDIVTLVADKAEAGFASAQYDGDNDVTVSVVGGQTGDGQGSWSINASGTSVLFIEYGTGVKLPHTSQFSDFGMYPPASWSATHSGFLVGKSLQKHHGQWPYNGTWTDGNPSNNIMYYTKRNLDDTATIDALQPIRKAMS